MRKDDLDFRQKDMKERVEQAKLHLQAARKGILEQRTRIIGGININGRMRFKTNEIRMLSSHIVYVFYLDSKVLYVGKSSNGVHRPFNPMHDVAWAKSVSDRLDIYSCKTERDASKLEGYFIHLYRPSLNVRIEKLHM